MIIVLDASARLCACRAAVLTVTFMTAETGLQKISIN